MSTSEERNGKDKVKINMPKEAWDIIHLFYKNNFEAYIVGGCVRDCLLKKIPSDWDITTNALPEQIKKIFENKAKVVETGIKHGTVTLIINKKKFEVTTYRNDGAYKDFRRPEQVFFVHNLEEDLARRDFCMNAMAYNDKNGLVDLFDGKSDIVQKKIIRCVGEPEKRFSEDALRMLRALRFANQLDFSLDAKTYLVLKKKVELMKFISIERIRDELVKLFFALNSHKIYLLNDSRILNFICPDFDFYLKNNFVGIKKNLSRLKDFHCDKNLDIILCTLLYRMNSRRAYNFLRLLKFDNKTCYTVTVVLSYLYVKIVPQKYFVKRIVSHLGIENFYKLLVLKKILGYKNMYKIKFLVEDILLNQECLFLKDLAINGGDIAELGFSGKDIGRVLNYLLNMVYVLPKKNSHDMLVGEVKKLRNKV